MLIRSSVKSQSLHTRASRSPTFALVLVLVVLPFPKIILVVGPLLVFNSCVLTVDSRRMIASAPESRRA